MVQTSTADSGSSLTQSSENTTKITGRPIAAIVRHRRTKLIAISTLGLAAILLATSSPAFATTSIDLGSAATYAVIAGSTITNTGPSVIHGDIGLSPGTSITGFPPGLASGTTNNGNSASLAAQTSSTAAYKVVATATPASTVAAGTLGGTILLPGDYHNSTLSLNGTLTLNGNGDSNSIFIFQSDSTLITASSSRVLLENGAQACNVFWQFGSSATLGTTTNFSGTILALTSATLDTGATVDGRILAQTGAVTLDSNTVTVPTCSSTTTAQSTATTVAGSSATATSTVSNGTTIPNGAPSTGRGGTAGPTKMQLGLVAIAALLAALGAGAIAVRTRRQSS